MTPVTGQDIRLANGNVPLPRYLTEWGQTLAQLREPFDPDFVYFLPQTVNYKAETAIAAAYATPRAYSERLNAVIGGGFWRDEVTSSVIAPFTKIIKAKMDWKTKTETEPARDVAGTKVGVFCRVAIWMGPVLGWVHHDSTGGEDTSDENWSTTAEAQAYKRAISKWGPGEYFYHFGKQEYSFDTKKNQFKVQPVIPDWAYPRHDCDDCGEVIGHLNYKDKAGQEQFKHFWDIVTSGRQLYGRKLCVGCAKKARAAQTPADVQTRLQ